MPDSSSADNFVSSPMRDNWYQRCSYLGSTFALITSVSEDGQTNIGPYQLSFPFEVNTGRSWMVISRSTSNTATNVHRTHKCALNFIEYDAGADSRQSSSSVTPVRRPRKKWPTTALI